MSGGFQLFDIIILAVIAAFFILRLRNVLGKRTGHQDKLDPFAGRRDDGKIVNLPDRRQAPAENQDEGDGQETANLGRADLPKDTTPLAAGLSQITAADPSFSAKAFEQGARMAFEMIVNAYARGDLKTLRPLLSNEVFEEFAGAVRQREAAGETLETTFVGIREAEVSEAEMQGKTAFVTVRFVSEQTNVTRDKAGAVIAGDPTQVDVITDLWTFARNTRSRDPNWTLVATDTPS